MFQRWRFPRIFINEAPHMAEAQTNPQDLLTAWQRALHEFQEANKAEHKADEDLQSYKQQRAQETAAGVAERETAFTNARDTTRAKRNAADALKTRIDNLVKGIEEGTVNVPEPVPGDAAAAARIKELEEAAATNEQRLTGVASQLDAEGKALDGAT